MKKKFTIKCFICGKSFEYEAADRHHIRRGYCGSSYCKEKLRGLIKKGCLMMYKEYLREIVGGFVGEKRNCVKRCMPKSLRREGNRIYRLEDGSFLGEVVKKSNDFLWVAKGINSLVAYDIKIIRK